VTEKLDRVVVLGTSGAGKSTLARGLAERRHLRYVELDRLHHLPGWRSAPTEEFRAKLDDLTQGGRWVTDGNYIDQVSDLLWPRAGTVIWLDLPLSTVLRRLTTRSVRRIVSRETLWNGNRENLGALFGRNSVLRWAVKGHRRHRKELPPRLLALKSDGVDIVRLHSGREASDWLRQAPPASAPTGDKIP
jgi:adenylate kinase family enzyme